MTSKLIVHNDLRTAAATKNSPISPQKALRECVEQSLDHYFAVLDGQPTTNLYQLVLQEVEVPLLAAVMRYTGNQCEAAQILGLSRGTLRKKLQHYDLI